MTRQEAAAPADDSADPADPAAQDDVLPPECDVAISGGGIAVTTYSGVFSALHVCWRVRNAIGVSAGAIAAACILLKTSYDVFMGKYECVFLPCYDSSGDLLLAVKHWLESFLPEDAHQVCSGRLTVVTTRVGTARSRPFSKELHTQFPTRKLLISVLLASSRVPFLTCKGWGWDIVEPQHTWHFDGLNLPDNLGGGGAPTNNNPGGAKLPTFVFSVMAPSLLKIISPQRPPRIYGVIDKKLEAAMNSPLTAHVFPGRREVGVSHTPWLSKL